MCWPPVLLPGADEYLDAFWELSSERQLGFGAGPIPGSAIVAHAGRAGMADDEADLFRRVIRAMDAVYLDRSAPRPQPSKDAPAVSSRPLTPGLFQTLFERGAR